MIASPEAMLPPVFYPEPNQPGHSAPVPKEVEGSYLAWRNHRPPAQSADCTGPEAPYVVGCLDQFPGHILYNEKTGTYEVYFPPSPSPQTHVIGTLDDLCNAVAPRTETPSVDGNGRFNPTYAQIMKDCRRNAQRGGGRPLTVRKNGEIPVYTNPNTGVTIELDYRNDVNRDNDEPSTGWGWDEIMALALSRTGKVILGISGGLGGAAVARKFWRGFSRLGEEQKAYLAQWDEHGTEHAPPSPTTGGPDATTQQPAWKWNWGPFDEAARKEVESILVQLQKEAGPPLVSEPTAPPPPVVGDRQTQSLLDATYAERNGRLETLKTFDPNQLSNNQRPLKQALKALRQRGITPAERENILVMALKSVIKALDSL